MDDLSRDVLKLPEKVKADVGITSEEEEANLRAIMRQLEGEQQPRVKSEAAKIDALLTEQIVRKFEQDGAVLLKRVFSQKWIDKIKKGIEKNVKNPSQYSEKLKKSEKDQGAYFDDYCNWRWITEFGEYVWYSPAAQIASRLLRTSELSFYHEHVLNKEPGTCKETPWHQDQPYYPVDGDKVCSIWMPVDPVPQESTLKFVAGSHKWGPWYIPRKFATEKNYPLKEAGVTNCKTRQYQDVPVEDIESGKWPILQWSCEPGDAIVFHMRTLHGAAGNTSTTTHRRVLSTRWLGDDAVMGTRPWDVSPPITGGLHPGDRMISSIFPLVFTRGKL